MKTTVETIKLFTTKSDSKCKSLITCWLFIKFMSKRYYNSKLHILQEEQKLILNRDIYADSTEQIRVIAGHLANRKSCLGIGFKGGFEKWMFCWLGGDWRRILSGFRFHAAVVWALSTLVNEAPNTNHMYWSLMGLLYVGVGWVIMSCSD